MRSLFTFLVISWVWMFSASHLQAQTPTTQDAKVEEMRRLIRPEFFDHPHFRPLGYDKTGLHYVILPIDRSGEWPEAWSYTFQTRPGGGPYLYGSHVTLYQMDCKRQRVRPIERTERHGTEVISSTLEKGQRRGWHKVKLSTPLGNLWKMACMGNSELAVPIKTR